MERQSKCHADEFCKRSSITSGHRTRAGVQVALIRGVTHSAPAVERRSSDRPDRRKQSRSGRRASDPHFNWRRLAWLFMAYATFLSLRTLPSTLHRLIRRKQAG